jgi:cytochrome P450
MPRPDLGTPDPGTFEGCPVVHTDYRVDRPILQHYELFNADRETAPFLRAEFTQIPFWMATRYEHVLEALQMPDVFGNETISSMNPNRKVELLPQSLNPPEHTKLRRVINRWFSPAAVRRLEPLAASRCIELIEELAPRGECDLVAEFAIRFPTDMFLATLGLPVEDGGQFLVWVEKIFAGFFGVDPQGALDAQAALHEYFNAAADDRVRRPRDPDTDFLTRMVNAEIDGEKISRHDLLVICLTLMAAGLDTTRSALGYIFYHLATHESDRRRIIDDPAQTPAAIEEFIRLYPLVFQDGRLVKSDIDFHGCPMKKGDILWLGLASSNRDPREFDNPDEFVVGRPNVNHHLGFGAGPHRCLGMHLARHELVIAVNEWHKRIPDYEIAATAPLTERGFQLSLRTLPLRWSA